MEYPQFYALQNYICYYVDPKITFKLPQVVYVAHY